MSTGEPQTDDTAELTEIAVAARRAGLRLSTSELAELVGPYRRNREQLAGLRATLDPVEEPAVRFDPTT